MPLFTGEKKRKLLMDISSFLGFCSALSSVRLYCTFPVVSELLACFVSWVQSQTYLCKYDAEHVDCNSSGQGFSFCHISAQCFVQGSSPRTPMAVLRGPSMAPKTDLQFRETLALSL